MILSTAACEFTKNGDLIPESLIHKIGKFADQVIDKITGVDLAGDLAEMIIKDICHSLNSINKALNSLDTQDTESIPDSSESTRELKKRNRKRKELEALKEQLEDHLVQIHLNEEHLDVNLDAIQEVLDIAEDVVAEEVAKN